MADVDSLVIEIGASSSNAATEVDKLSSALDRLRISVSGATDGLSATARRLSSLAKAANSLSESSIGRIRNLGSALQSLRGIENVKISSTIGSQLKSISEGIGSVDESTSSRLRAFSDSVASLSALRDVKISSTIGSGLRSIADGVSSVQSTNFSGISKNIKKLASAIEPLSNLGKNSFSGMISSLSKIEEVSEKLGKEGSIEAFGESIGKVADAMKPLVDQAKSVYVALNWLPAVVDKVISSNGNLAISMGQSVKQFNLFSTGLSGIGTRDVLRSITSVGRRVKSIIGGWISESNAYIENLNLFTVSMGKYADEAQKYAERVSAVMGIDPSEWMRAQGVFMTLATGFGVTSEKAALMSKNLTQLSYDISSFYNIKVEDAVQKLQSAFSGELEPVRRLGYDLSQVKLQELAKDADTYEKSVDLMASSTDDSALSQIALANGIKKNVSQMTQAEKSQLRYIALMTQVTQVQGDMARTLESPANQLRIFQASVTQAGRALGNIFIPLTNKVLPYVIAFVNVIRWAADQVAAFFGFSLPEIDYSGIENVVSTGEDAENALEGAGSAAKDLKNALLGIDELNIISPDTGGAAGAGQAGTAPELDFALPEYDFLGDVVTSKAKEIEEKLKPYLQDILELVASIGAGFAAWKIASKLIPNVSTLGNLLGSLLIPVGAAFLIDSITDILFEDGLTWENILTGSAGGAIIGGGLGAMLANHLGIKWYKGMLWGGLIGLSAALLLMSLASQISDGISLRSILIGSAGAVGLGLALAKKLKLSWKAGVLSGLVLFISASLLVEGVSDSIKFGPDAENMLKTSAGSFGIGALIAARIAHKAGLALSTAGGPIFLVACGISMLVTSVTSQIASGSTNPGAALVGVLGSIIAGAGIGTMLGGPGIGTLVGGTIGLVVGVSAQLHVSAEVAKANFQKTGEYEKLQGIISDFTFMAEDLNSALNGLKDSVKGFNDAEVDAAFARALTDELFDLNAKINLTNEDILRMQSLAGTLNSLEIPGLKIEFSDTGHIVGTTRKEVESLIAEVEELAKIEALQEVMKDAYKLKFDSQMAYDTALEEYKALTAEYEKLRGWQERAANNDESQRYQARMDEIAKATQPVVEVLNAAAQGTEEASERLDWAMSAMMESYGSMNETQPATGYVSAVEDTVDPVIGKLGEAKQTLDDAETAFSDADFTISVSDVPESFGPLNEAIKTTGQNAAGLADEMPSVGINVVSGIAEGMTSNTSQAVLRNASEVVSQATFSELKSGLEINSPSGLTYPLGEDITSGVASGMISNEALDGIETSSEVVANHALSYLQLKSSGKRETYQSIGSDIPAGVAAGIRSNVSAINKSLDYLSEESVSYLKEKLDIHSPSGVFEEETGIPIPQGVASGIRKGIHYVFDAVKGIFKETQSAINEADPFSFEVKTEADLDSLKDQIRTMERDLEDLIDKQGDLSVSLVGDLKLFDKDDGLATIDSLQQQIADIDTYSDELAKLRERDIPQWLLDEVLDLGISSATELASQLNSMNDDQFETYVRTWEELQQKSADASNEIYGEQIRSLEDAVSAATSLSETAESAFSDMREAFEEIVYDSSVDYMELINKAVAEGNMSEAARLETLRNAKIAGEGLDYEQTFNYQGVSDSFKEEVGVMKEEYQSFSDGVKLGTTESKDQFLSALSESETQTMRFTESVETMFKNMATKANAAISSIISSLNSIPRDIRTVHTIVNRTIDESVDSSVPGYAMGGFPEHGQMFFARESGPELVGTIGGQTAVANNDQIVEGIRAGVETANSTQNALLAEQNELLRAILAKEGRVSLDGKTLKASIDKASRKSGATIMAGGVMA